MGGFGTCGKIFMTSAVTSNVTAVSEQSGNLPPRKIECRQADDLQNSECAAIPYDLAL